MALYIVSIFKHGQCIFSRPRKKRQKLQIMCDMHLVSTLQIYQRILNGNLILIKLLFIHQFIPIIGSKVFVYVHVIKTMCLLCNLDMCLVLVFD